jgi:hypothetical protein
MKIYRAAFQLGIAIQATLSVGEANAQANLPQVVIVFDSSQTFPVPIPSWTVLALLALLTLCAYRAIRTREIARTHGRWLVAVITATLLSLTFSAADSLREVHAQSEPPTLILERSPGVFTVPSEALFNMNQSGSGYGVAVANKTGFPATITERRFNNNSPVNPLLFYWPGPPTPGPECTIGYVLTPDATCYVFMHLSISWS